MELGLTLKNIEMCMCVFMTRARARPPGSCVSCVQSGRCLQARQLQVLQTFTRLALAQYSH